MLYKRSSPRVCVMDDGEYLFENCHVVTLASVWDGLIQSTRPFLYIQYVLPFLCYQKIHILISGNFFFVFIPLHGSNCPPGTRVGEKKSHSTCKLDHLFFIQTDPFCIPTCRPNGDLSVVRDAPSRPPGHTTAFSVQLLECQGLYLGALLSHAVCFL